MFLNHFYKRKLVIPFLDNLYENFSNNNGVFFSEYNTDSFFILLCIKNTVYEIIKTPDKKINYFKIKLNDKNFIEWDNYKNKILKLKIQASSVNSKHIILLISENIRHISNQHKLTFFETKKIFEFLLIEQKNFFDNNIIEDITAGDNKWID